MISVIIPTFNRAAFLVDAIQSVAAPSRADVEIIVADDGSTDNTAEIVNSFGQSVMFVPLPHRGQPAATRNGGLGVAHGEFVAFLDSDDVFRPGKLALQLASLQSHPEAGLVYSNAHFFRNAPDEPIGYLLDGLPTPSGNVFPELLRGNFLAPPAVLVRRACLDAVGWFDEEPNLVAVEDYDLWLRLAARFPFVYVEGDVAAIRRHPDSISRDAALLRRRMLRVLKKIDGLYPELMHEYANARHEAYARNHGAIALACLKQRRWMAVISHGLDALFHTVRMPGFGLRAFRDWWTRRHLRATMLTEGES